jgi:hypothetical protein
MAPLKNNEKKNSLLPMILINRFERICGTFRRRGGKNPLSSMTLDQIGPPPQKKSPLYLNF